MDNTTLSILIGSGPAVFIAVRYCDHLASRAGLFKLICFLGCIFAIEGILMLDRFDYEEATRRASAIAVGYLAAIFVMAAINAHKRDKEKARGATAADTPSTPPGRAP